MHYRHHACGEISNVDLRCAHCGEAMRANDIDPLPGPAHPCDRRFGYPAFASGTELTETPKNCMAIGAVPE